MLAKINRLTKKGVIRVKKSKIKIYSPGLLLLVQKRALSSSPPRIAIIVSKKTARLATDRNTIKRQIKSTIIANLSVFPQGKDLLFLVSKKYASFHLKQKQESIISVITKSTKT